MRLVVKDDEPPNPRDVGFLGSAAVVTCAHGVAHAIEQARRVRRRELVTRNSGILHDGYLCQCRASTCHAECVSRCDKAPPAEPGGYAEFSIESLRSRSRFRAGRSAVGSQPSNAGSQFSQGRSAAQVGDHVSDFADDVINFFFGVESAQTKTDRRVRGVVIAADGAEHVIGLDRIVRGAL